MAKWLIIIIISLMVAAVKCGINLRIFENLNDVFILITNKTLEATNDKNLSLTCKAFDSVGNDINDDDIIWGKKGKGIKFFTNFYLSSDLNFTPIKLNNEGQYFCGSLKYGLYKIIFIIVKEQFLNSSNVYLKKKRWKRTDVDSVTLFPKTFISNYYETTTAPKIDNLYPDNQHQPFDYNNNDYSSDRVHSRRKDYSYAGVITAIVAVILVIGAVLYRLMKRLDILYAETPQRTSNVEPACEHPTCGQYCTMAVNHNRENNIRDLYHGVHMPANANTISSNRISTPTLLSPLTNTTADNQASSVIDLPPSYDSSVNHLNGKYDSPPTYYEAISYISGNPNGQLRNFNKTHM
ncbi:hypothetical protein ILUMI_04498 [Ignelater luminosus]|uniref:Ig-like domain-containing protein n=1 Tax=Ignelater luminosus TaxID=2038154 RepID=A0A8K0D8V8_IGNLU|nr:hypothetical protein ILUMI_04498 [Ignelater luminosus]